MWALIDNYDSFSYILADYLRQLNPDLQVWKNDEVTLDEVNACAPDRIILSPGPRRPDQAGITKAIIAAFYNRIPLLGICLGHQAMGEFFGATLDRAQLPVHGKVATITHNGDSIFRELPREIEVMRYHSLVLNHTEDTGMMTLAQTAGGELMAFRHRDYPCIGVQFHPESVRTRYGFAMLKNWNSLYR